MITVSFIPDILLAAIFSQRDVSDPHSILDLSISSQFNLVYNALLFAIAAILALALVFLNAQALDCQQQLQSR